MAKKKKKIIDHSRLPIVVGSLFLLTLVNRLFVEASETRSSKIGIFEGETTFSLTSETGILPTIEIETKDVYGNVEDFTSSTGTITIVKDNEERPKHMILKVLTLTNFDNANVRESRVTKTNNQNLTIYHQLFEKNVEDLKQAMLVGKKYLVIEKWTIEATTGDQHMLQDKVITENGSDYYVNGINSPILSGRYVIKAPGTYLTKRLFTPNEITGDVSKYYFAITVQVGVTATSIFHYGMILEYQEGMESWDIEYFEDSQSIINPVLTIANEDASQVATVTVGEPITLRSNGEVYDELDLMTGKFTQRINEDGTVLDEEVVRYIKIKSTHTFEQNKNADVSVVGNITPILGSITVPSDPLSFTLNPNLEEGQQFVAPEFSVSNDNQAPIGLEVKSFEQTTTLLNDVLPNKYDSWEGLNKTQSKDIALSLEPQLSDGWLTLNEGSYYVANTSDIELGRVKGNSTVHFKFSALHGQSFTETLNPQYKLTFVFEL